MLQDGVILSHPHADLRHHHPRRHPAGNNQERSSGWLMEGEVRRRTRERAREKNEMLQEEGLQHSSCQSTSWRHSTACPASLITAS